MKKVFKRTLSLLLAITIIFSSAIVGLSEVDFRGLFEVKAQAADSGTCGDNLTWVLDNNGTLTISGTGIMDNYDFELGPDAPWYDYRYDIKKVVINEGVTRIGSDAFAVCTNLSSITLPDSIKSIGPYAFYDCTSLASISIPVSVTSIGWAAFYNCNSFKSIEIPDSVTSIGSYAFYDCTSLASISIPDSVTSIGENVFCNTAYYNNSTNWINHVLYIGNHLIKAGNLFHKNYTIKAGTKTIGGHAFSECNSLTSITIPGSVTSIGDFAFDLCTRLTSVTIGNGVTNIGDYAFYYCYRLTSITIPDSVTSIGSSAFKDCTSLTDVYYGGTQSDWANITIGSNNGHLKNATIHNHDHTYSNEWVIDVEPTCTDAGSKHKECTVCGGTTETEIIPATGHIVVKDVAIEATCTATGKTEGSHCSVCNEVIVAQATIPAKGHTSSDWMIDTAATVSAPGSEHKECLTCGELLETVVIPQLKPATPKVATENALTGVFVKWNGVEGAVKYNVYRRQGGQTAWILVGSTTGTSLTDTKVTSGIYYVYSVRAYNSAGQYSDFVNANTNTRKYMAVPKLTGISNATNGLYITWNVVSGVTNGYRVYRRGAGSTYWTYLGTTKNLYFIDSAVKNKSGEYFRYTVIADGDYHSKFDTTGLYLKRLANPTLTSAVSSKSGITVKWGAVKGTTGYYVYRKTANSSWVRIAAVGGTNSTAYLDKTARKGTTYTYTVRAVYGATTSAYNSGISCYDKY